MTLTKISRAGLLALAAAFLLAIMLSLPTWHVSHAEDAATPAPAAAAAPAAAPAPPATAPPLRRCWRTARRIPATPPG